MGKYEDLSDAEKVRLFNLWWEGHISWAEYCAAMGWDPRTGDEV